MPPSNALTGLARPGAWSARRVNARQCTAGRRARRMKKGDSMRDRARVTVAVALVLVVVLVCGPGVRPGLSPPGAGTPEASGMEALFEPDPRLTAELHVACQVAQAKHHLAGELLAGRLPLRE